MGDVPIDPAGHVVDANSPGRNWPVGNPRTQVPYVKPITPAYTPYIVDPSTVPGGYVKPVTVGRDPVALSAAEAALLSPPPGKSWDASTYGDRLSPGKTPVPYSFDPGFNFAGVQPRADISLNPNDQAVSRSGSFGDGINTPNPYSIPDSRTQEGFGYRAPPTIARSVAPLVPSVPAIPRSSSLVGKTPASIAIIPSVVPLDPHQNRGINIVGQDRMSWSPFPINGSTRSMGLSRIRV